MGEATGQIDTHGGTDLGGAEAIQPDDILRNADTNREEQAQIRSDIEQTRAEMGGTIDALEEKLDPSRIAERVRNQIRERAGEAFDSAKETVKEATVVKAGKLMGDASEKISDFTQNAGSAMRNTSSSVAQYVNDNAFALTLIGAGAGILAWSASHDERSRTEWACDSRGRSMGRDYETSGTVSEKARAAVSHPIEAMNTAASSAREAAAAAMHSTREQVSRLSDQARQSSRNAGGLMKRLFQENPIAVGIAALAAGAIVGVAIPSTRLEGEYMGEARDNLVGQAKSMANEAAGKVRRATEEVGRTLKDVAHKEGLAGESTNPSPS